MRLPPASDDGVDRRVLPAARTALAGVVLCGGAGRRMGLDKATVEAGGMTLLDRAIARLSEACDPVLIAPGDRRVVAAGHAAVADAVRGAGPLGALVAALRRSPHRHIAVVAVDMPWLDPALLELLAARIGDHDVAACETERGLEPLHAVYARSALPAAEAALDGPDRSLRGLVDRLRVVRITQTERRAAGISDRFARNVNTPAELEELRRDLRR